MELLFPEADKNLASLFELSEQQLIRQLVFDPCLYDA
jgi:hypothetical protein